MLTLTLEHTRGSEALRAQQMWKGVSLPQSILCPQPSHILGTPAPMVLHSILQVLPRPAYPEASAAPPTPLFTQMHSPCVLLHQTSL